MMSQKGLASRRLGTNQRHNLEQTPTLVGRCSNKTSFCQIVKSFELRPMRVHIN